MAKPLVALQQGCHRGLCPELSQVVPGRTTSSASVLDWYSSPWQQVYLPMFDTKLSTWETFSTACAFQLYAFQFLAFLHTDNNCEVFNPLLYGLRSCLVSTYIN